VSAALSLPLALASVGGGVVGGVGGAYAGSSGHFNHSAMGTVFWPNPVQELGNERLTDRKDHEYRALLPA